MNPPPINSRLPAWLISALWTVLVAVIGTAVLILLIVLFHELHLTGSAADWLATLCNIVMAGAAVAAFKVARSWLPQLATQEGYKLAIRLVNEQVLTLGHENTLQRDAQEIISKYNSVSSRDQKIHGPEILKDLYALSGKADDTYQAIRMLEKQMATYGLTAAPDRAAAFDGMVNALDTFSKSVNAVWILYIHLYNSKLQELDVTGVLARLNNGASWSALLQASQDEMAKAWDRMTEYQQAFLGTDSRVGKLFVVRK